MISFEYFVKRRNLKTENIIRFNNLDTYEKFCEHMKEIRVLPPKKTLYEEARKKVWPEKVEVIKEVKNEEVEERNTSEEKKESKAVRRRYRKKSVSSDISESPSDGWDLWVAWK